MTETFLALHVLIFSVNMENHHGIYFVQNCAISITSLDQC